MVNKLGLHGSVRADCSNALLQTDCMQGSCISGPQQLPMNISKWFSGQPHIDNPSRTDTSLISVLARNPPFGISFPRAVSDRDANITCHDHLRDCRAIPRKLGHLSRVFVRAAGRVEVPALVLAKNAPQHCQGYGNEHPNYHDDDNCAKWQRCGRLHDTKRPVRHVPHCLQF